MLNNFFKLNQPYSKITTLSDLETRLLTTNSLKDFLFEPNLEPPSGYLHPKIKFKNKTFTNASFSKKIIRDVIFINCVFKDCLFIGSNIQNCEFQNCKFENVNTYKIEINNTFLKPHYFKNAITDPKYSNIAIHLFQKIFENTNNLDQLTIVNEAEVYFRDWERIHLKQKWIERRIKLLPFLSMYIPKFLHYCVGYGIRFRSFFVSYFIMFLVFFLLNHTLWDNFDIKTDLFPSGKVHTALHSAYFTFYNTTSLGAGEMFPQTSLGITLSVTQSIVGYIFIGVFLSMLVKRIIR